MATEIRQTPRPAMYLVTNRQRGPKATAIADAEHAGRMAAYDVLQLRDRTHSDVDGPEPDGYRSFENYIKWGPTGMRGLERRTAQLVIDAFCDAFDDAIYTEASR